MSWRTRLGYGCGDYGINLFWQAPLFYLFFFYTDVLGISSTVAGTIFLIGGLWDAISDPTMGYIAERTRSHRGAYRPYLLFGSVPLALSFMLLLTPLPLDSEWGLAVATTLTLILFRTCYTLVSIPYSALSARITHDWGERTRLAGVRIYCGYLGGITVTGLGAYLQERLADTVAFPVLGAICGVLAIMTLYICYRNTQEIPEGYGEPAANLSEMARTLPKNGAFLIIFGAILFVTVAATISAKSILYFFEYDLGDRGGGNRAIFIITAAHLVMIPFWSFVALRTGKRRAWILGSLVGTAGFATLFFDRSGSTTLAILNYCLINLGLSAFAVLFWSMLPDTVEWGEYKTGVRNESIVFGIVSSAQKASLGGSALLLGILLDQIGYQPGQEQTQTTLDGLRGIITIIPAAALICGAALVFFYPISKSAYRNMMADLRPDEQASKE